MQSWGPSMMGPSIMPSWPQQMATTTPYVSRPSPFASVYGSARRGAPPPIKPPVKVEEDERNCALCKRNFSMGGVEAHIKEFHIGDSENIWRCGQCHFKTPGFNEIGAHCLQVGHDSQQIGLMHDQNQLLLSHLQQMQAGIPAKPRLRLAYNASPAVERPETPSQPSLRSMYTPVPEEPEMGMMDSEVAISANEYVPHEEAEDESQAAPGTSGRDQMMVARQPSSTPASPSPVPPPPITVSQALEARSSKKKKTSRRQMFNFDGRTGKTTCDLCKRTCHGLKRSDGSFGLNITGLRYHAVNIHLDGHVYICNHCEFGVNKATAMRAHAANNHNDPQGFRFSSPSMGQQVWEHMERCFPLLLSHTKREYFHSNVIKIYSGDPHRILSHEPEPE